MGLESAFNSLLFIHSRTMTIERSGVYNAVSIQVSPSNYSRKLEAPEETIINGREYVISKKTLDSALFPAPKRGDRLRDSELGTSTINEVNEMFDFGGRLIGFRVRTG